MPAGEADAQVQPFPSHFQAILTARGAGFDIGDLTRMRANRRVKLTSFDQCINPITGVHMFGRVGNHGISPWQEVAAIIRPLGQV